MFNFCVYEYNPDTGCSVRMVEVGYCTEMYAYDEAERLTRSAKYKGWERSYHVVQFNDMEMAPLYFPQRCILLATNHEDRRIDVQQPMPHVTQNQRLMYPYAPVDRSQKVIVHVIGAR